MSSHIQFTGPSPDLLGARRDGNNKNELGSIRSAIKNILNRLITIEDNINKNNLDTIHQRITSQHESFANAMETRVKNEHEFRSNLERDRQLIYELKNIIINNNNNYESDSNNITNNNKTLPFFSLPPSYTPTAPTAAPLGFELIISNLYQEISSLKQSRRDDIDKMNFLETKLKATEICLLDNINQWNADQEEIRSVLSAEITARRKAQSKIQSTISTSNINYANSNPTSSTATNYQSNRIDPELIASLTSDVAKCNFKVDTLDRTVKALESTIINKIDDIQTNALNANMNMKTQIATIKAQQSQSPKPASDGVTTTTTASSTNPTTSPYITSVTINDLQRRQGVMDRKVDNLKVRLESIEKVFMHATDFPPSLVNSGDKPTSHQAAQPNNEVTAVSHKSVKKAPTVPLHHTPTEPSSAKSSQLSPRQATREIGQNYDSLITPTLLSAIEQPALRVNAQELLVSNSADRSSAQHVNGGDAQEADDNVRLDETIDTPGMAPHDGMREVTTAATTVPAVELHELDTLNEKLVYTTDDLLEPPVVEAAYPVDEKSLSEAPEPESAEDMDLIASTPIVAAVNEGVVDVVVDKEDVNEIIAISDQPAPLEEPVEEQLAHAVDAEPVEEGINLTEEVEQADTLLAVKSDLFAELLVEPALEGDVEAKGDGAPPGLPVSLVGLEPNDSKLATHADTIEATDANADIVEPSHSSNEAVEVTADVDLGHIEQPIEASLEPTITGEDTNAPEDGGHSSGIAPQIETEPHIERDSTQQGEDESAAKAEVATTADVEQEVDTPAATSELADLSSADEATDTALVNAAEEADEAPLESASLESAAVSLPPLLGEAAAHIPVSAKEELAPEGETDTADPVPPTNEGSELLQDTLSPAPINVEEETFESAAPVEKSAAPVEKSAAPVKKSAAPVEESAAPVEEPTAPVEKSAAPVEKSAAPVEESAAPVEEPTAPVEEPTAPVEEPTAPVEESAAPVEESAAPVEESENVNVAQPLDEEAQAVERSDIAPTDDEAVDLPSTATEPPADEPGANDLNREEATPEPLVAEAENILLSTEQAETPTVVEEGTSDVAADNVTAPESEDTLHAAAEEADDPVSSHPIDTDVADAGVEVQSDADAHRLEPTTDADHATHPAEEELLSTSPNIIEAPAIVVTDEADLKPTHDKETTEENATATDILGLSELPSNAHAGADHTISPSNDPAESPTDPVPAAIPGVAITSVKSGDEYAEDEFESVKDAPTSALSHEGHTPPETATMPEDTETAEPPSPSPAVHEAEPTAASSSLPSADTAKPTLPTVASVKCGDDYDDDFESINQAVNPTTTSPPTTSVKQPSEVEMKHKEMPTISTVAHNADIELVSEHV